MRAQATVEFRSHQGYFIRLGREDLGERGGDEFLGHAPAAEFAGNAVAPPPAGVRAKAGEKERVAAVVEQPGPGQATEDEGDVRGVMGALCEAPAQVGGRAGLAAEGVEGVLIKRGQVKASRRAPEGTSSPSRAQNR